MSDEDKEPVVECAGIEKMKDTGKHIDDIFKLIQTLSTSATKNTTSLEFMAVAIDGLAKSNTKTHAILFTRTENLNIDFGRLETSHKSHLTNSKEVGVANRHKGTTLISYLAIGISVAALVLKYVF